MTDRTQRALEEAAAGMPEDFRMVVHKKGVIVIYTSAGLVPGLRQSKLVTWFTIGSRSTNPILAAVQELEEEAKGAMT